MINLNLINGRRILTKIIECKKGHFGLEEKHVVIFKFSLPDNLSTTLTATDISTKNKITSIQRLGVGVIFEELNLGLSQKEFIDKIHFYNNINNCIGIIVQEKIPKHFRQHIWNIQREKDIDGLTKRNLFPSMAVSEAAIRIFEGIFNEKNKVAVLGSKGNVGSDITHLLDIKGVKYYSVDKNDDLGILKNVDIIFSAVGSPGIVNEYIRNQYIIDMGFYVASIDPDEYLGDVTIGKYPFATPVESVN